jgi:hypothetical protein
MSFLQSIVLYIGIILILYFVLKAFIKDINNKQITIIIIIVLVIVIFVQMINNKRISGFTNLEDFVYASPVPRNEKEIKKKSSEKFICTPMKSNKTMKIPLGKQISEYNHMPQEFWYLPQTQESMELICPKE